MKFLAVILSALLVTGNLTAGLLPGNGSTGGNILPGTGGNTGTPVLPGGTGGSTLPSGGSGGGNVLPSPPASSGGGDLFVSATRLSGLTVSDTADNTAATKEAGEPNHSNHDDDQGGKSLWWSWTSNVDGQMIVSTEGSSFDTVVAVYTGSPVNALTLVGSDDNSGSGQSSRVSVPVLPGIVYYIAVDGYNGESGSIALNVAVTPTVLSTDGRPVNDDFAQRKSLSGAHVIAYGSNENATLEDYSLPIGVFGLVYGTQVSGQNVWWSWTAPSDGTVTIDTIGSSYDTTLFVYTGDTPEAFVYQGFDDQEGGANTSLLKLYVTAGTTYHIAVDGWLYNLTGRSVGSIVLNIDLQPNVGAPKNDTFDFRTGIQGDTYSVAATVKNSFTDVNEPAHGDSDYTRSLWWTWNSPSSEVGTLTIKANRDDLSNLRPIIAVYTGDDYTSLVPVASALDTDLNGSTTLSFVTEPNATYHIAVAGTVLSNNNNIDDDGKFDFSLSYVSGKPAFASPLTSLSVVAGATATFTVVPTSTTLPLISYQWQRKIGTVWSNFLDGGGYSGAITSSLTITPASLSLNGQMFRCVMTNASGSVTSAEATLWIVPAAPTAIAVTPVLIKPGTAYSQSVFRANDSAYSSIKYYAQGLPAGLQINASTGVISGTVTAAPGSYTVTYWTQSGTVKSSILTAVIVITPFPTAFTGSFEALILDNPNPLVGIPLGKLEVSVTSTGAFTGKFTSGAASVAALKGQLARSADDTSATASVAIVRKGFPKAQMDFAIISSGITATFKAGATTLGTAVNGVKVSTSDANWADTYTMVLNGLTDLSAPPPKPLPAGSGYASLRVGSTGIMTVAGRNADGTPLTASLASASDATYRLYAKPTAIAGTYVGGWLKLSIALDAPADYEGTIANNSDLYWQVAASTKNATYKEGFGPVGLSARIDAWDNLLTPVSLNLTTDGFFEVEIDGDGVTNVGSNIHQLPELLRMLSGGQIILTDQNYRNWSVTVNPATGVFTGSFTLAQPTKRSVTFGGILSQLPVAASASVPFGQGYFLLPSTVKKGPVVSGSIEFVKP